MTEPLTREEIERLRDGTWPPVMKTWPDGFKALANTALHYEARLREVELALEKKEAERVAFRDRVERLNARVLPAEATLAELRFQWDGREAALIKAEAERDEWKNNAHHQWNETGKALARIAALEEALRNYADQRIFGTEAYTACEALDLPHPMRKKAL